MSIYFNSRDPACKSHFGAAPCGTEVSFSVFAGPEEVTDGQLLLLEEFSGQTGHPHDLGRRGAPVRIPDAGGAGAGVVRLSLTRPDGQVLRLDKNSGRSVFDGV